MKLKDGTEIDPIMGYVGINAGTLKIASGYDDGIFLAEPYGQKLSREQLLALADEMVDVWRRFRAYVELHGREPGEE